MKLKSFAQSTLLWVAALCILSFTAQAQIEVKNPPPAAVHSNTMAGLLDSTVSSNAIAHLTFGLNKVTVLRENHLFGEALWKYLASLIYIVLAFYVAKFLDFFVGVWLKRWAEKTDTTFDDLLLELLRGPVKVVSFVVFLHIGLNMFAWPSAVREYLAKGFIVIVACSVTYVALRVVDLLLNLWHASQATTEDKLFSEQLLPLVRKTAKMALAIVAILLTADNLGIEIKAILAGLSVGGLALGLAAQDTVANLFGAVAIILDKPFRIGDRIKVESVEGNVETIGLRSTRIRSLDGNLVTIPNKAMGNATIINVTRRPSIKTEINIGITYDTASEKVKRATEILGEVFRAHPMTQDLVISFNKFNDSALNLLVVHWWGGTDTKTYLKGMQELNLAIKQRFDAEKIDFAFPTQTLHIKPVEGGK